MPDATKTLNRGIFQRLLGRPATKEPGDPSCWTYSDGRIVITLERTPELAGPGRGIRLEGQDCPERVLVIHGDDGEYHAFRNKCTHGGRRLDPVPGAHTVQCCSVGKTTFGYQGQVLAGAGKEGIPFYPVQVQDGKVTVTVA
jgi:nitrite reductase/ring-hydroxylating ferredoxin subunit